MSVIARRVAASPARTGTQTWDLIRDLLFSGWSAPPSLTAAAGPAASSIAERVPEASPFVLTGAGPRVRVYCLYGDDAVEGDDANEAPVDLEGDGSDWTLWLPCHADDLAWGETVLVATPRVKAYDAAQGLPEEASESRTSPGNTGDFQIDTDLFNDL
jgi:hypothetical protein